MKGHAGSREGRDVADPTLGNAERRRGQQFARRYTNGVRNNQITRALEAFDVEDVDLGFADAVPGGQRGEIVVP